MTKFSKEGFSYHGGYLNYYLDGKVSFTNPSSVKFVARFKHNAATESSSFKRFLMANFTVEEYFGRMEANETPLKILESKGYVMAHIKKWLREAGLPETQEGQKMLLERQRAAREAK